MLPGHQRPGGCPHRCATTTTFTCNREERVAVGADFTFTLQVSRYRDSGRCNTRSTVTPPTTVPPDRLLQWFVVGRSNHCNGPIRCASYSTGTPDPVAHRIGLAQRRLRRPHLVVTCYLVFCTLVERHNLSKYITCRNINRKIPNLLDH